MKYRFPNFDRSDFIELEQEELRFLPFEEPEELRTVDASNQIYPRGSYDEPDTA